MNTDKDIGANKNLGAQGAEDTVKGKANQAAGKVQKKVGQMTGDRKTAARGKAREVGGKVQSKVGKVERKADQALDNQT